MVISQYIVGIIGVTAGKADAQGNFNKSAVSAMIAFICINISMFASTWGPCAWVVIGEVFPLPIRSRGVGLSTSSNWFWNCVSPSNPFNNSFHLLTDAQIIAIITPYLVDKQYANLSSKIFFMWGSLCIVSVLFAYFLVPETKGLSLEQVDRMLEEVSPRNSRSWVPHSTFAAEMGLVEKGIPTPGMGGKLGDSAEETEVETQTAAPNKEIV